MALTPDFSTFIGREGMLARVAFKPAKPDDSIAIYALGCKAGVVGATIGLYQFNVVVPFVAPGEQPIELTVDGVSNAQNLSIVVGQ